MKFTPSQMTNLMKKARPFLIESGKILLKTTADVLTQPRPGEKFKSKLTRIAKQTGIELCGRVASQA